ncbi:Hpt domain-containing protein [Brevundimonas sp. FT23028]|uniref:Hpt domain-containing protein n=1 Tax=Brevundimonas sp. FT23028 TaxID=3393748 RepID=UPI003B58996C
MSDDTLAAIRARFRLRALADADALAAALDAGDPGQIEALVHGLAGAAGIFGFTEISEQAKAADGAFAGGRAPTRAEIETLIALILREMA